MVAAIFFNLFGGVKRDWLDPRTRTQLEGAPAVDRAGVRWYDPLVNQESLGFCEDDGGAAAQA